MEIPATCLEFFSPEAVITDIQGRTKKDILTELLTVAVKGGILPKGRKSQALESLMEREARGSTGVGRGMAIPHAKISGLRRHAGILARSVEGVDFQAVDGEPVHVFVMLISPDKCPEEHLAFLRWVSTLAREADFSSFVRQARSEEEIFDVLRERAE